MMKYLAIKGSIKKKKKIGLKQVFAVVAWGQHQRAISPKQWSEISPFLSREGDEISVAAVVEVQVICQQATERRRREGAS